MCNLSFGAEKNGVRGQFFGVTEMDPGSLPGVTTRHHLDLEVCEVDNVLYYTCAGVLRHDRQNH